MTKHSKTSRIGPNRATRVPEPSQRALPVFASEEAERAFWAKHDSADYVNWAAGEEVTLPKLRPSTMTISLRLSASLLAELKVLANKQDVPYQSLLKMYLAERVSQERLHQVA